MGNKMVKIDKCCLIKKIFSRNNINLPDEIYYKFVLYMENLIEWNSRMNLTAIKDEEGIIIKHFLDSIMIKDYVKEEKILDIGSGAGFPGIPLKIIDEKLDLTLMDAVNKKVLFMNDSIDKLGLKNAIAIHGRAEDFGHNEIYRECFDTVISRAVANMSTLVEYMLPFVKSGGYCLCMKGPDSEEEINDSKKAINVLGGKIEKIYNYEYEENKRCLVVVSKIKDTEQTYPRKQGKPSKNPIR